MRADKAAGSRPALHPAGIRFATVCATSALLYASWLLGTGLNPGLDEVYGYVSELSARDQPGSVLFRATDAGAGALAVLAAVLGARRCPGVWARAGWAGLAVFGAATAVNGTLTPMDCATFVDSGCALREAFGLLSPAHRMHSVTSSLAGGGALLGMAGLGMAARTGARSLPGPRWALAFSAVTALATAGTLVALLTGGWAGVLQRLQLLVISGWLLALAAVALRHGSGHLEGERR